MVEAYQAEYEHTNISIVDLLTKYQLTYDDIKGYKTWKKPGEAAKAKRKVKVIDKVLATIDKPEVLTKVEILPGITIDTLPETTATEAQLLKINRFKELAVDHCLTFMERDAKLSEVKEFKDIVNIIDSLEKSYQKTDPDAGKPTINILVQNLMERFNDDC